MGALAILLQALTASNQLTPLIASLIASIQAGKASGKTDDEILAEAMTIAQDTDAVTKTDMGPQA